MFLPSSQSKDSVANPSDSDFSCQSSTPSPSSQMAPSAIPPRPCARSSKSSAAIPVYRESQAYDILNTFPERDIGDYDLLLKCPQEIQSSSLIAETLKTLRAQGRRVTFDPELEILKVQGMPHPLHDAICEFLYRSLVKANREILSFAETECISLATKGVRLSKVLQSIGGKQQAWRKHPDGLIVYGQLGHRSHPRVVFEVGVSEKYLDLLDDARQWLLRSHGRVGLVVIIKITEDLEGLRAHQQSITFKSTLQSLVSKYGDDTAVRSFDVQSDAASRSTDTDFDEAFRAEVVTSDWVGSFAAFLEFWELREDRPCLRGSRVEILPEPLNCEDPRITIQDLIPPRHRCGPDFDSTRSLALDMSAYRALLAAAKDCTAFNRAVQKVRPDDGKNEDPDYVPSDEDQPV
ncbi:uncharacterized protein BDW47DRAFT_109175 [Aspergillus candidus]|uniref:Uncharacterized protein n=1 Tax=Aspergillus candidus TaxID=41067 RepID=A0A2I2F6C5_ASPCN|nr:hypothetical protein BDW47DRAFT_109175 [Aspergillus candidus]PLB36136.1 hypothetical protein BDW47DRAFT_109175 [Aspergillus candidus]